MDKRYWTGAAVVLAWAALFSLRLLPGVTLKTLAWVFISAFLFWPLVFRRWSRWLGVVAAMLVGVLDIFYVHYFNTLTDEFFLATVLRTTREEATDLAKLLPAGAIAASVLWLVWCRWIGRFLDRHAAHVLKNHATLRWSGWVAVAIWAVLAVLYIRGDVIRRFEIQDKTRNIYPLHLAWAAVKQRNISDASLYAPILPTVPVRSAKVGTLVVVLGESASAQRWSLLGYGQDATNAPLQGLPGLVTARAMAQYFNTAGALPFVLTGRSIADSVQHKAPSFLDIAQYAGYKVFVFSNSRTSGDGDFFARVLRRSSAVYQKIGNGGEYDDVLTAPLRDALRDPAPLKLIVLHTFGSHELVEGRYPPEYAKFSDPYDNSILYTSALLKQWIGLLGASTQGPALLLYTSDHGLSMPPCSSDYVHGRSLSALEVPYLAWGNAATQARLPALLRLDAQAVHSNALVAERAIEAVGYGALLNRPGWPSSLTPTFEGHTLQALRKFDACTLR